MGSFRRTEMMLRGTMNDPTQRLRGSGARRGLVVARRADFWKARVTDTRNARVPWRGRQFYLVDPNATQPGISRGGKSARAKQGWRPPPTQGPLETRVARRSTKRSQIKKGRQVSL